MYYFLKYPGDQDEKYRNKKFFRLLRGFTILENDMIFKRSKTPALKSREIYIKNEQLKLLYSSIPAASVVNLMICFLLPLIFGSVISPFPLYIAVGSIAFSAVFRGSIFLINRRGGEKISTSVRETLFLTGFLTASLAWGSTSYLLFPVGYPIQQAFLTLILAGVISAAIVSFSKRYILALSYTQIVLIPLILRNFLNPSEIQIEVILLILFYNFFICTTSYRISRQVRNNLILAYNFTQAEEELNLSEQRFETIFHQAPTGIFYYDSDLILHECNEGFSKIINSPKNRVRGLKLKGIPDTRVLPAIEKAIGGENGYYEGPYNTISELSLYITLRTSPIRDSAGSVTGGVAIVEDITEKTRIQQEIHHQAYHDALTGLPNRQLMRDRLSQALKSAQRHNHKGVLLYLDLDKFKQINDSMGHQTGDILLKEVASRLLSELRDEDTVSRMGGDEFVILLPEIITDMDSSVIFARTVADKIHATLGRPFLLKDQSYHTSASIGVIIFDGEEQSPETVLKYADTAMYNAKEEGRNRTSFFHKEMDTLMREQVSLEADLKKALEEDGLEIFLQPIVDINENRISGAEALLRWFHPEKGFISPEKIILTAENTGQIVPLGSWIMEKSLSIYAGWIKSREFLLDYLSINISIKQMMQPDFVEKTIECIRDSAIPPERIVLEITESILITDFDNTVKKMKLLREFGVHFALDDFGTGYSSLSYLKKLPLDKLKIDRIFTENLLSDPDDYALVETIMGIASHFDLKVITEGVEEAPQVDVLREMGCPFYQGYFCSKPISPADFLKFARDYNKTD